MYLFFDVEAIGMPKKWSSPHTDSFNWPRMFQIAWLTFDENKKLLDNQDYLIKPDGLDIPVEVERRHGTTMELAREKGLPIKEVLQKFAEAIPAADYLIAHNMVFNERVVAAEFHRHGVEHPLFDKERFCVMRESTHYCKLPGKKGRYKWPTQKELYIKLFKKIPKGLNNATLDVRVTANCFFTLVQIGALDLFEE